MTERQANDRRNWKAMLFPYDTFIPDESEECQYCLTDKQATYLRGLLEPAGWKTRWWSDENEIDQDKIESFRDDLIRRLMMPCCGGEFEIIFQWTEDGVLQQSSDGGATWEDAPQEDPRNSSTVYPPTPGEPSDDKKCIAAAGMALLVKEGVGDQLTDDMGRYTLGQLISDWVTTIIQSSNPFEALIQIVTNQIFALLISAVRAALTEEVYHTLQCIFYCNIEDDLSFTDEGWAQVRSDILDQIPGIAGVFLEHLVFLLGKVGLTNLARSQAATEGECSECDCNPTCGAEWSIFGDDPTHFHGEILEVGDDYLVAQSGVTGGSKYLLIRTPDNTQGCIVTEFEDIDGSFIAAAPAAGGSFVGETIVEGSPNHFPADIVNDGNCMAYIQFQADSGLSFKVKLHFAPC